MTSNRWAEINRLYNAVVDVEEKERGAFLEKACGDDAELRREVESLLAYDQQAQQLLDRPAMQMAAEKLAAEPPSLVGRQLGPYQILGVLGAGGMGQNDCESEMPAVRRRNRPTAEENAWLRENF